MYTYAHTYITGSFSVFPGGSRATGDWGSVRGEGGRARGGEGQRGINPDAPAREGTAEGGEVGGVHPGTDRQGQGGADNRGARWRGQEAAAQASFPLNKVSSIVSLVTKNKVKTSSKVPAIVRLYIIKMLGQ